MPNRSVQSDPKATEFEDNSSLKQKSMIQKFDPKSRKNLKMRKE